MLPLGMGNVRQGNDDVAEVSAGSEMGVRGMGTVGPLAVTPAMAATSPVSACTVNPGSAVDLMKPGVDGGGPPAC